MNILNLFKKKSDWQNATYAEKTLFLMNQTGRIVTELLEAETTEELRKKLEILLNDESQRITSFQALSETKIMLIKYIYKTVEEEENERTSK